MSVSNLPYPVSKVTVTDDNDSEVTSTLRSDNRWIASYSEGAKLPLKVEVWDIKNNKGEVSIENTYNTTRIYEFDFTVSQDEVKYIDKNNNSVFNKISCIFFVVVFALFL